MWRYIVLPGLTHPPSHTFHRCFMDLPIAHILQIHGGYFFFSYSFIVAGFGDFARLFAKTIPIEIISQYQLRVFKIGNRAKVLDTSFILQTKPQKHIQSRSILVFNKQRNIASKFSSNDLSRSTPSRGEVTYLLK